MTTQASPGDLLRHYRRRKGWSQAQLAAKAGISTPFMTLIEQGRRRPREDAANHLVAALGLDETEAGELKAALLGRGSEPDATDSAGPLGVLGKTISTFLATPPNRPKELLKVWRELVMALEEKVEDEQAKKSLEAARLLGMGYFCQDANELAEPKRDKGKRQTNEHFEYRIAKAIKELILLFSNKRPHAFARAVVAEETVSFAKWRMNERMKSIDESESKE